MHKLSVVIKSKWHPQAMITAENYLDKLKVLHQSENFLAVDKMADLVMNTNPGDERLSLFDQIKHRFPHLHQPARARSWLLCPPSLGLLHKWSPRCPSFSRGGDTGFKAV